MRNFNPNYESFADYTPHDPSGLGYIACEPVVYYSPSGSDGGLGSPSEGPEEDIEEKEDLPETAQEARLTRPKTPDEDSTFPPPPSAAEPTTFLRPPDAADDGLTLAAPARHSDAQPNTTLEPNATATENPAPAQAIPPEKPAGLAARPSEPTPTSPEPLPVGGGVDPPENEAETSISPPPPEPVKGVPLDEIIATTEPGTPQRTQVVADSGRDIYCVVNLPPPEATLQQSTITVVDAQHPAWRMEATGTPQSVYLTLNSEDDTGASPDMQPNDFAREIIETLDAGDDTNIRDVATSWPSDSERYRELQEAYDNNGGDLLAALQETGLAKTVAELGFTEPDIYPRRPDVEHGEAFDVAFSRPTPAPEPPSGSSPASTTAPEDTASQSPAEPSEASPSAAAPEAPPDNPDVLSPTAKLYEQPMIQEILDKVIDEATSQHEGLDVDALRGKAWAGIAHIVHANEAPGDETNRHQGIIDQKRLADFGTDAELQQFLAEQLLAEKRIITPEDHLAADVTLRTMHELDKLPLIFDYISLLQPDFTWDGRPRFNRTGEDANPAFIPYANRRIATGDAGQQAAIYETLSETFGLSEAVQARAKGSPTQRGAILMQGIIDDMHQQRAQGQEEDS